MCGPSLAVEGRVCASLWWAGLLLQWLPCCRAQAPGHMGSVVVAHGLTCSMAMESSRPGVKPLFPVSAGRFLSTVPPGNLFVFLDNSITYSEFHIST